MQGTNFLIIATSMDNLTRTLDQTLFRSIKDEQVIDIDGVRYFAVLGDKKTFTLSDTINANSVVVLILKNWTYEENELLVEAYDHCKKHNVSRLVVALPSHVRKSVVVRFIVSDEALNDDFCLKQFLLFNLEDHALLTPDYMKSKTNGLKMVAPNMKATAAFVLPDEVTAAAEPAPTFVRAAPDARNAPKRPVNFGARRNVAAPVKFSVSEAQGRLYQEFERHIDDLTSSSESIHLSNASTDFELLRLKFVSLANAKKILLLRLKLSYRESETGSPAIYDGDLKSRKTELLQSLDDLLREYAVHPKLAACMMELREALETSNCMQDLFTESQ